MSADIEKLWDKLSECRAEAMSPRETADALLAAGWSPRPVTRHIEDRWELAELPTGAIVVAAATGKAWQRDRMSWVSHRGHLYSHELFGRYGGLTLVYTPEATS